MGDALFGEEAAHGTELFVALIHEFLRRHRFEFGEGFEQGFPEESGSLIMIEAISSMSASLLSSRRTLTS